MPWKMIRFLFIITLVILFIGLNSGNSSDITLWFGEKGNFKDIPIYISLFAAYVLGAISVIPFAVNNTISRYRKRKKNIKETKSSDETISKSGKK